MPTSTDIMQAPESAAQRTTALPSMVSGKNGSAVTINRQANRLQQTAEPSSNMPICGEIQSNFRLPQLNASNNSTAAVTIKHAPTISSRCLR